MKAQEFNMSEKYGIASKSNGEEAAARDVGKKNRRYTVMEVRSLKRIVSRVN